MRTQRSFMTNVQEVRSLGCRAVCVFKTAVVMQAIGAQLHVTQCSEAGEALQACVMSSLANKLKARQPIDTISCVPHQEGSLNTSLAARAHMCWNSAALRGQPSQQLSARARAQLHKCTCTHQGTSTCRPNVVSL